MLTYQKRKVRYGNGTCDKIGFYGQFQIQHVKQQNGDRFYMVSLCYLTSCRFQCSPTQTTSTIIPENSSTFAIDSTKIRIYIPFRGFPS